MKKYEIFTKTATFLFPFTGVPKEIFKCEIKDSFGRIKLTNRLINCYLADEAVVNYDFGKDFIFVLINGYQDEGFLSFFDTLQAFSSYVDNYERNNSHIFVFKMLPEWQHDVDLILEGKYSCISQEAKTLIMKNYFYTGQAHTIPLILSKAIALKTSWESILGESIGNQEVWSRILPQKEVLTDDILNYFNKSKNKSLTIKGEEY